jgi:hypothetical protein
MDTNAVNDKNEPGEKVDKETVSSLNNNDRNKMEMGVDKRNAPADTDIPRDVNNDSSGKMEIENKKMIVLPNKKKKRKQGNKTKMDVDKSNAPTDMDIPKDDNNDPYGKMEIENKKMIVPQNKKNQTGVNKMKSGNKFKLNHY